MTPGYERKLSLYVRSALNLLDTVGTVLIDIFRVNLVRPANVQCKKHIAAIPSIAVC